MAGKPGRGGKPGRSGRPRGSTKLAKLRRMASYEKFLEFLDEFEWRLWALERARKRNDYAFVHRAIEDLTDRAKGRAPQSVQPMIPGNELVVRIIDSTEEKCPHG